MDQSREQKALRALYSDETENYRFPIEPSAGDWVTIRFRTLKNSADMVWIVYGSRKSKMLRCSMDDWFDYYEIRIRLGEEKFSYYFEIFMAGNCYVYTRTGIEDGKEIARTESGTVHMWAGSAGSGDVLTARRKMDMDVNRGADDRYGMSVDANQAAYAGAARMDFVNGRQLSLGGGRRSDLGNVEGVVPSSAAEQTLFSADQVRRCFVILPGFVTPAWAKGAVMYQIFVDRFCNGDPSNDVLDREYAYIRGYAKQVKDWNTRPEAMDVRSFYGGDLAGVMSKLDYLKELGVDVLYLNPIFVSPSNHKYDIQDYDYVDPHYGKILRDGGEALAEGDMDNTHASRYISRVTDRENLEASNELFAQLVHEAHARGMKVILDGVFNHCGSFNKWMDRERIYEGCDAYEKGAYVAQESPYHDFFSFREGGSWPYNGAYEGWWDHDTLPKLNYEQSVCLQEYVLQIGRKWVSAPYCADGWRLDVAADLGHSSAFNHDFWKRFRQAVKTANPEAVILAEHYGDASDWLQGDEWDTVMNYDAFMEPVTWFLTGMEKHSDGRNDDLLGDAESFRGAMKHHMCSFAYPSLVTAMNELSNHDHSRFLTRTNRKVGRVGDLGSDAAEENVRKAVFKEAVLLQMTWPGAPTIYYGDEAGVCGFTDPDNRRTYPWGAEDQELVEFHRQAIAMHKRYRTLTYGSLKAVHEDRGVLCYGRFDSQEQLLVILNNRGEGVYLDLPVWEIGVCEDDCMENVLTSWEDGFSTREESWETENGWLHIYVPAENGMVLRAVR